MEYNNALLRPIDKTLSIDDSDEEFTSRKRKEREDEDHLDEKLSGIEDDILVTLSLRRRKRKRLLPVNKRRKKRGRCIQKVCAVLH